MSVLLEKIRKCIIWRLMLPLAKKIDKGKEEDAESYVVRVKRYMR